jgi:hypothetical protein
VRGLGPPPGLCIAGTLATGVPAVWEPPFQAAVQGWWSQLIAWAAGSSADTQIGYIRFGFSIGSEATINCTQYLEAANGGGGDSAMETTWLNAYGTAASYLLGQVASLPSHPSWVPMMTVNMGQSLTTFPGGTDPSWATGEAQILLANQPFGIGTQGLENGAPNGTVASDPLDIQNGNACTGSNCCSDNWCNTRSMVVGQVPVIELQDCNLSDSAGGATHCLDSVKAMTATDDSLTLSQVFVLSTQHGTTSAEIYYGDLECAIVTPPICSSQANYKTALLALAAGQPTGTSALMGSARLMGSATMF